MKQQKLVERLRQKAKSSNLTLHQISKAAGLDAKTLKNFFEENWNPRLSTLLKVEMVLS